MSVPPPRSELDQDKVGLLDAELDDISNDEPQEDHVATTTLASAVKESNSRNGFLAAPRDGPIRPLSPDTMSNLSMDEYEQIRPSRSVSRRNSSAHRLALSSPARTTSRGWRGKIEAFWIHNKGLLYMLAGQFFGCLMNVTTRLLEVDGENGQGLHPFQILFARMSLTLALSSLYMYKTKTPDFPFGIPEVRWLLIIRGFSGFFGVYGMYFSLLYLPLADATVITFLAPGLACWACSILIKEPFTRIEQIAGLVSLFGVVLIARPTALFSLGGSPSATGNADGLPATNATMSTELDTGFEHVTSTQRLTAVGIAMVGVLGSAITYTVIRWIGKRAHPLISVNYFAAWCTLVSTVMMFALPGVGFLLPASLKQWGLLFSLGACGFVMQFLLSAGLAYEKSSRATNIIYTQMLFALTFDKLCFGHTPDLMSIAGSTLILGSALYVALQGAPKQAKEQQTDGPLQGEDSQRGLMSELRASEEGESRGRVPAEEVQLRVLR